MDIRQFSPQTQRTLAQRDFNQDSKLTVRELEVFKTLPEAKGIAPKDLAVIQDALKKAKGPDTIIVSLVEDELPPGMKKPEPIYTIKPDKAETGEKAAGATKGIKPAGAPGARPAEKSTGSKGAKPQEGFQVTASQRDTSKDKVKLPNAQPTEALDIQTTTQAGALKVKSSHSFTDGQHKGTKLNASIEPGSNLGLSVGVETAEQEAKAKTGSSKTGTKASIKPAAQPVNQQLPQQVTVNSQVNAGPLKLSAQGKLNQDSSRVQDLSGSAELQVIQGHKLKASVAQGDKRIGFSKVGTSHDVGQGVNLTTHTQLDESTGKVKKYGAGISYSATKDSGLEGLSFSAEALARNDSSYTRPLQGWEKPEMKFEFRFSRPLS